MVWMMQTEGGYDEWLDNSVGRSAEDDDGGGESAGDLSSLSGRKSSMKNRPMQAPRSSCHIFCRVMSTRVGGHGTRNWGNWGNWACGLGKNWPKSKRRGMQSYVGDVLVIMSDRCIASSKL
jgi:hypothetical protein